jgi:2,3-bisphosphoglycerate-independent phosphoglycerate mutase
MRQLRIAESEKFPHVTYFFNGGRAIKFTGEDRVEVPSPDVPTYDQKPEMSLPEVTKILLDKISLHIYDFIMLNIANGDMVGHTGELQASIQAMEYTDKAVKSIVKKVHSIGGCVVITADHGNVEEVINLQTNQIDTEHSLNPVPFIIAPPKRILSQNRLTSGKLADVAPTILRLMGLEKTDQMTGSSLVK